MLRLSSPLLKQLQANWKAGLTIALVSIPLAVALAVASQVTPAQGLITAIWAGLVAALAGSSRYNIIGPTGALSGLISSFVLTNGLAAVSSLAITVGIIILLAYIAHFERYLILVPASVIHGFTLGVALIIMLGQLPYALGLPALPVQPELLANVWQALTHLTASSLPTVIIFLSCLLALRISHNYLPQLPGPLLLAPAGILLGYTAATYLKLATLGSKYGALTATVYQLPTYSFSPKLLWPATVIALVAMLETLLSAKIADQLTKTKHHGQREILGLGLANIASGLLGGIPATAALARTALNIKSGATSKLSAMIASGLIAILALGLLPFFQYLPLAVIAAILVNISLGMIEIAHFQRLFLYDKANGLIALLVAAVTVYQDPLIGILGGAVAALLLFVEKLTHGFYELTQYPITSTTGTAVLPILIYTFKGKLSYLNAQSHLTHCRIELAPYQQIVLCLNQLHSLDLDGVDALTEIIEAAQHQHKQLALVLPTQPHLAALCTSTLAVQQLAAAGLVCSNVTTAVATLQTETRQKIHTDYA